MSKDPVMEAAEKKLGARGRRKMAACLDCGGSECICTYKRLLASAEKDSARLDALLDPEGDFVVCVQDWDGETPWARPIHSRAQIDEVMEPDDAGE
jgi:hypothetical protein